MGGFSSFILEQKNSNNKQKQEAATLEEKTVKKSTKKPVDQKPAEVLEPVAKEEE